VALEYQVDTMPGPMVIAKGEDEIAARIRNIARDNGVPIVENKPVAQALYRETEVGQIIPLAYYTVVAMILAKVMTINEARRKERAQKAAAKEAANEKASA
jgi:flagellar biosynthetic protein FlhB